MNKKATRGKARLDPIVRCQFCAFADDEWRQKEHNEDSRYVCKRFPPKPLADAETDRDAIEWPGYFAQPTVRGGDWCGEFKARTERPKSGACAPGEDR